MNHRPYITISLPCYQRPQRTIRAIRSVLAQTYQNFELMITVDGDMELKDILTHFLFPAAPNPASLSLPLENCLIKGFGGATVILNGVHRSGYWGTDIRNKHIREAEGKYFIFMGSDDELLPNHLENYVSQIEGTDLDFIAFDSYVEPNNAPRNTQFQEGMIGHSELIVRTEFLRSMPPHEPVYGHDWTLVKNMMEASGKYKKAVGAPQTYIVKAIPGKPDLQGID